MVLTSPWSAPTSPLPAVRRDALKLYDRARLNAPGTIVEEAALRRSVAICVDAGMVDKGLEYSQRYIRRYLHSPYASQFADLFVKLLVDHDHQVKPEDVVSILSFMDGRGSAKGFICASRVRPRLPARANFASMSAARAQALAGNADNAFGALADFYGGMAAIPTDKINAAAKNIDTIADSDLSPRDKALRAAAKALQNRCFAHRIRQA